MNIFKKPELTDLYHYDIHFHTVDKALHIFTGMKWCDSRMINCTPLEYYLSGKDFLQDDNGIFYPLHNVLDICAVNEKFIVDAVRVEGIMSPIWYEPEDIKIFENGEVINYESE